MRFFYGRWLAASMLLLGTAAQAQVVVPPSTGKGPAPAPVELPKPTPAPAKSAPYAGGMKINLSPDGSKYVRVMTAHQFWAKYTENNSNTTNATEELASSPWPKKPPNSPRKRAR